MEKINKILMLLLCVFLCGMTHTKEVRAEEYEAEMKGLDVIFVMDYSGSMKTKDPGYFAPGMVKAFVDTVHSADIRIGFIAYNDRILSSASPVLMETSEERQTLKALIDRPDYAGNTDTGLGLRQAYDLAVQEKDRKQVIVLISDGETDLTGSKTGRELEHSIQDIEYVTTQCREKKIPVYTVAFDGYDGNAQFLETISSNTGGSSYLVETPEALIEVLYGIFEDNMDFSIEKITDGIYAPGEQNIRVALVEPYVDELDVLLISPKEIGTVQVSYGDRQIEASNLRNYAVAKITEVDNGIRELMVRTDTEKNQELQLYLINYRDLTPVLEVEPYAWKNETVAYQLYFKNQDGSIIDDQSFYETFSYQLTLQGNGKTQELEAEIKDGRLQGVVVPETSGTYYLSGSFDDHMGSAVFPLVEIQIENRSPEGGLPKGKKLTCLSKDLTLELERYFSDPDGDKLQYALDERKAVCASADLQEGLLEIHPIKSGTQEIGLLISDGEETVEYSYFIDVVPLWKAYWWLGAAAVLAAVLIWKITRKKPTGLERLETETKQNRFAGKLDAYFTTQPEVKDEIPPLSFQMHKIKDNKIALGSLLREYPDACDTLKLDEIFLVADEDRRMILYHNSNASVMVGNSIICRQIQYSISFGDVLYITSEDGSYDLEIHYISVIQ